MGQDDPGRWFRYRTFFAKKILEKYVVYSFVTEVTGEELEEEYEDELPEDPRSIGAIGSESSYVKIYKSER